MNLLKFKNRTAPNPVGNSNNGKWKSNNGKIHLPPVEIFIDEIVESTQLLYDADGKLVFSEIVKALNQNRHVRLSFRNIENMLPGFIIEAIFSLHKKFKENKIEELLELVDISEDDKRYIEMKINQAKRARKMTRKQRKMEKAILNDPFIW